MKYGGLDNLGYSRKSMLENIDVLCEKGREKDKAKDMIHNSLFSSDDVEINIYLSIQDRGEYDVKTLLDYEYECMGIYVSGHPLDDFKEQIQSIKGIVKSIDLENLEVDSSCMLVGKVLSIKRRISKKSGKPFGSIEFLDYGGSMEIMVFEKQLESLEKIDLQEPIALKCKVEDRLNFRILKILTLREAKKEEVETIFKKTDEKSEDEIIPIDMSVAQVDMCMPLCVVVDTQSVQDGILEKLKAHAQSLKGEHELHLRIKDDHFGHTFVSNLKVHSSIKEVFRELEWQ